VETGVGSERRLISQGLPWGRYIGDRANWGSCAGRGCWCFCLRRCGIECGKAPGQKLSRVAVSKETEVADAYETFGEQMQEEAAQELIER